MKYILLSLLTFVCLLNSTDSSGQTPYVVILNGKSQQEIDAEEVGSIKSRDKNFKNNCSYEESTEYLKESAIEQGANLIKIIKHKKPDGFNPCHRFDAVLYKADNPRSYEKEIVWSSKRKLTWDDFRAEKKPPAYNAIALTYCGIKYSVQSLTSLYGSSNKYIVECVFYTEKSWITDDDTQLTEDVLKHEQLHFDLCEVYARRLYKELSSTKLNAFNLEDANVVFERVHDEYEKRQMQYDEEVYNATSEEVQNKWSNDIAKELSELEEYANRD